MNKFNAIAITMLFSTAALHAENAQDLTGLALSQEAMTCTEQLGLKQAQCETEFATKFGSREIFLRFQEQCQKEFAPECADVFGSKEALLTLLKTRAALKAADVAPVASTELIEVAARKTQDATPADATPASTANDQAQLETAVAKTTTATTALDNALVAAAAKTEQTPTVAPAA
jgi:hypothetical protein